MLIHDIIYWVVGGGLVLILGRVMWILWERVGNVFNPPKRDPQQNTTTQNLPLGTLGQPNIVDKRMEELQPYRGEEPHSEEVGRWPQ